MRHTLCSLACLATAVAAAAALAVLAALGDEGGGHGVWADAALVVRAAR